jgi:hypothetical protein
MRTLKEMVSDNQSVFLSAITKVNCFTERRADSNFLCRSQKQVARIFLRRIKRCCSCATFAKKSSVSNTPKRCNRRRWHK